MASSTICPEFVYILVHGLSLSMSNVYYHYSRIGTNCFSDQNARTGVVSIIGIHYMEKAICYFPVKYGVKDL